MRAHILQHAPFEDIGAMASWLEARGVVTKYTRFLENARFPQFDGINLVIAAGGPMSINDASSFAWLRSEKQSIRPKLHHELSDLCAYEMKSEDIWRGSARASHLVQVGS